jgi:hypothetical protein
MNEKERQSKLSIQNSAFIIHVAMLFGRHVDCDDSAGQVMVLHFAESRPAKQFAEPFLIRKTPDRRRKVFIHTGPIMRNFGPDPR